MYLLVDHNRPFGEMCRLLQMVVGLVSPDESKQDSRY